MSPFALPAFIGPAIGTGLTALGVASSIPIIAGFGDQIRESKLRKGPNDDGKFDTNFLENLLIEEETLMPQYQKIEQKRISQLPQVLQRTSVGVPGPTLGQSQDDYLSSSFLPYRQKLNQIKRETQLEDRKFQYSDPEYLRRVRVAEANAANQLEFQRFNMTRLLAGDKRAFEAQQEANKINLFKAMNDNNLAVANLDLRKQDQANDMEIYKQRLADTKELKQNALLAAVVDGIGLTARGLIG